VEPAQNAVNAFIFDRGRVTRYMFEITMDL